ncbi:MAG: hypothetical protein R3C11_23340 [Planctomycetaceae bacterium]
MGHRLMAKRANTPDDKSTSSQLWSGSYYAKAWFSYAIIGVSCAVGLLFVIVAQSDSPISVLESVNRELQNSNGDGLEDFTGSSIAQVSAEESSEGEEAASEFGTHNNHEQDNAPIQQAFREILTEDLQPSR